MQRSLLVNLRFKLLQKRNPMGSSFGVLVFQTKVRLNKSRLPWRLKELLSSVGIKVLLKLDQKSSMAFSIFSIRRSSDCLCSCVRLGSSKRFFNSESSPPNFSCVDLFDSDYLASCPRFRV